MGIYQHLCYKVEDLFVKILASKQEPGITRQKVDAYRKRQFEEAVRKKQEQEARLEDIRRKEEERQGRERQEVLAILSQFMGMDHIDYTTYEFNEISKNKAFFKHLTDMVLDKGEKGLAFQYCEFNKSSRQQIRGYLIATSKKALFISTDGVFQQKFRYQTVQNVQWLQESLLEKKLYIQYGTKQLEFDKIYDLDQIKRVGNVILNLAREVRK